jgi:hypothetical protein
VTTPEPDRIFLAEGIDAAALARHAGTIARASRCAVPQVTDSQVASRLLTDPRWDPGDAPLWDRALARLSRWVNRIGLAQSSPWFSTRARRGLLACGLEARLRATAVAAAHYDHLRAQLPAAATVHLDLLANDPYLRDGLTTGAWLATPPHSLQLHGETPGRPLAAALRELAATQPWLRALARETAGPALSRRPRTALVMTVSHRSVRQIESVLRLLNERGWRVVVVHYGPEPGDRANAARNLSAELIPFDRASPGWTAQVPRALSHWPRWDLTATGAEPAPLSPFWLQRALEASYVSGAVQIVRHRQMLAALRPEVIFGYGPDLASLALQVAADERSIPTVFVPHGYSVPPHAFWHFFSRAVAVYGPACVQVNPAAADGAPLPGLVVTGHPPHDAMVREHDAAGGRRQPLAGLTAPPHRPHLVLALAGWGYDLICHRHQERLLGQLAEALPADAYLLCKLHPGFEDRERCDAILRRRLPADAFRVLGEADFSTAQLLAGCDVAVASERSMVLADAVVLGRPAVAVHHADSPFGCWDRNHPGKDFSAVCAVVHGSAELRATLVALLHDAGARDRLRRARAEYLRRHLVADGRAAERVASLAEHLAAGGDPASFPTIEPTMSAAASTAPAASAAGSAPPPITPPPGTVARV